MSFMNSEEMTAGSIANSVPERRWHAARSRWWNSTGGGSHARIKAGNNIGKGGPGVANIKAGDGGRTFKREFPEEDAENWQWMEDNRIDPATGKILPDPEGGVPECSAEATRLRRILGGGSTGNLGQAAREAGEGWVAKYKWWFVGLVVLYFVVARAMSRPSNLHDL
jgi:ubiquitin-conjugating enzyme E2 J2